MKIATIFSGPIFALASYVVMSFAAIAGDCPAVSGPFVCVDKDRTEINHVRDLRNSSDVVGILTLEVSKSRVLVRNEETPADPVYNTKNPDGNWQIIWDSPVSPGHKGMAKVACENNKIIGETGSKYSGSEAIEVFSADEFTVNNSKEILWKNTTKFPLSNSPDSVDEARCFRVSRSWLFWAKLRGYRVLF